MLHVFFLSNTAPTEMYTDEHTLSLHYALPIYVQLAGVQLKAGDRVLLPIALAGRVPEQYEHPNEIRFDRNASNMTFGFGIHRCLGVYLAQREILFALEEMLSTVPQFRLKAGFTIPFRGGSFIQPSSLEIEWN